MMKNQKGITLIALVITIIVLLILAGVTIAMISGGDGILTNSTKAKAQSELGTAKDQVALAANEALTTYYDETYAQGSGTYSNDEVKTKVITAINGLSLDNKVTKTTVSDDGTFTLTCNDWTVKGTVDNKGGLSWGDFTKGTEE